MVVSRKSRSLKEVYIFFLSRYRLKKERKVMKIKKKINTLQFMWNNKNYPLPPTDSYLD